MKKKIVGIIFLMLAIAVAVPAVTSLKNSTINNAVLNTPVLSITPSWKEGMKLVNLEGSSNNAFGSALSFDGDSLLVGEVLGDGNDDQSGCAYVFVRSGTNWMQQAKLFANDGATNDQFGAWVALDSDTALIGACWDDDKGKDSGSVYVFTRSGTTWTQQTKLLASDGVASDWFGLCVSIDGDTALIGAQGDPINGNVPGSAYVFTRSGTIWTEEAKLTASDGAAKDCFGFILSLDGDTAVIGADLDDDNGVDSGSAYVFTRSGTTWTEQTKLLPSDGAAGDDFSGGGVFLSGDTVLIGAEMDDDKGEDSGSVYVFTGSGNTWMQQAKLMASDGASGDEFSAYGAIYLDGDNAIIGAWKDDDNGVDSGSAYIFTRNGTTWTQQQKLTAFDNSAGDQFGDFVAIDSDTAIVAAWFDDDKGKDSGSAYVFINTENQPPDKPTINGPDSGKVGKVIDYTFNASDPEGNQVKYIIDWGDGKTDTTSLKPSGTEVILSHTWSKISEYIIKANTLDENGLISPASTKTVNMPKNKAFNFNYNLLEWVFERHPNLLPILQKIIKRVGSQ